MTTITAYGHTIEVESLSPKGLEYLLTYGFKQSVADSSASVSAAAKKDGKSEAEIQALVEEARAKRVEAILNDSIGIREVGASSGETKLERETRKVGEAAIAAMLKAKGISLRAGKGATDEEKDELAAKREALYQKFLAVKGDEWRAEAERRLAATVPADDAGDEFDDILADFAAK